MNAVGAPDPDQHQIKRVNITNSLSTLNPAHYEAMNTATIPAQPGVRGVRPLAMRDVILWQQEQAQRLGEVGLTTNFPDPADIFNPFTINPSSEPEPPAEDRAAVVGSMQETHRAIMQVRQRKILMDQAGPLLASTEKNVDQKLTAAGVPEQELPHKSLRQKIVQLVEFKEPPPKANFVAVSVVVSSNTEGRSHVLEVNLPLKADVAEVHALLDEVVKALLSEKGLCYERGGAWIYQLVDHSHSQVLMDKSLPLETDLDYKTMLQQVSKVGDGKAPMAVLTQGGLAKPIATSGDNAEAQDGLKARRDSISDVPEVPEVDPYDVNEVLDEDGEPFFQPLDFERMIEKYADGGDDLTEENGIHGFWR